MDPSMNQDLVSLLHQNNTGEVGELFQFVAVFCELYF